MLRPGFYSYRIYAVEREGGGTSDMRVCAQPLRTYRSDFDMPTLPLTEFYHTKPLIFAHRGARRQAPENTIAAFQRAVELGCDGIELDVQRCQSGEIVVFHDQKLG